MATSIMKQIVNHLMADLNTKLVVPGTVKSIRKGLDDDPGLVPLPEWPYVALEDDGENKEPTEGFECVDKIYRVRVELGIRGTKSSDAFDTLEDAWAELEEALLDDYQLVDAAGVNLVEDLSFTEITPGYFAANPAWRFRESVLSYKRLTFEEKD